MTPISDPRIDQGIATDTRTDPMLLHRIVDDLVAAWRQRPHSSVTPMETDPSKIRGWLDQFPLQAPSDISKAVPELLAALDQWTVHTDHPRYFGLFNPTATWPGVAGELIAAAV